jgi:hypothetical protein
MKPLHVRSSRRTTTHTAIRPPASPTGYSTRWSASSSASTFTPCPSTSPCSPPRSPALTPYEQSIELSRLVLLDEVPFNAESWFVARCHHDLNLVGIRGVVSFSDPLPRHRRDGTVVMPGHVGTVYQALNFVYTGRSKAHSVTLLPDGSVMHGRAKAKIRAQHTGHRYAERVLEDLGARPMVAGEDPATWLRHALATIGAVTVRHPGNHRFCLTFGGRRHAGQLALVPDAHRPTRAPHQPELGTYDGLIA